MGLSAFNQMKLRLKREEEARKALASSKETTPPFGEEQVSVEKPKKKKTDAEKLKSKKN